MTTKILKTVLGIAFVSFFGTQSISAQSEGGKKTPPSATELMAQMDADEDGKLSKDEVKGPIKENFTDIDTDEDGYISTKELEAAKPKGNKPPRN
ncbi:EF-hand domain-containing protein [Formosa sp. PL04]|uniref:EF-hand domain-containing protein n=1 Tax=Formosa sp. PL04 TaxID=3081755 RepID=UPI00298161FB|nr:EF-hand domain-containing protein [Formosa sp. PL04]MDW5288500.1 EF-hand domain-containing protein [Formosa sp. PL04]